MVPRRRTVLAALAAPFSVALSGCFEPSRSLSLHDYSPAEVVERLGPTLEDDGGDVFQRALETGSATEASDEPYAASGGLLLGPNGSVYRLSVEQTDVPRQVRAFVYVRRVERATDGRTVRLAELPQVDRDAFGRDLPVAPDAPERYEEDGTSYHEFVAHTYEQYAAADSILLEERPTYVVADGVPHRVDISTDEPERPLYRYDATRVGPEPAAVVAELRETEQFVLRPRSSAERELLDAATRGDVYRGDTEYPDAWDAVHSRLEEHDPVYEYDPDTYWLTEYGGESYVAHYYEYGPTLAE